jgi:Flp pilus assembly protein TadD
MFARATYFAAALIFGAPAFAQTAPPLAPAGPAATPVVSPGLTPALAEAVNMIREGQYVTAMAKIEAVLAQDARNPQARFLKGVVQTDQEELDDAAVTFQALTEDFPELPEPHNNLAVIWAQQGRYDKARTELEIALKTQPDYAIAHENLGDVYARLAGAEYDRAVVLDKSNKSAQAKLALVRELYAVAPSSTAPKVVVPKPVKAKPVTPVKPAK